MTLERPGTPRPSPDGLSMTHGGAIAALAGVPQAVSSAVSLTDALDFVVHTTRALLHADRASILLLDPGGSLVPAVSAASQEDLALHRRFRTMTPISLAVTPESRALLDGGRAMSIGRASDSSLVPTEWQQAFGLESVALVPIMSAGEPCGVLVVDAQGSEGFSPEQLLLLEGVAASASIAVRDATAYAEEVARAGRFDRALDLAQTLGGVQERGWIAQAAMEGLCGVVGADFASLHVLSQDATVVTTLAAHGVGQPDVGVHRVQDLDPAQVAEVQRCWQLDPTEPAVLSGRPGTTSVGLFAGLGPASSLVVLPLTRRGRVRGFTIVGRSSGEPLRSDDVRLATLMAGQVWLAFERVRMTSDLQAGAALAAAVDEVREAFLEAPDIAVLVESLAPVVRMATGGELLGARLVARTVARQCKARLPAGPLANVPKRWRREEAPLPVLVGGLVAVPMLYGKELVGLLRIRPAGNNLTSGPAARFLLGLGAAAAELVTAAAAREALKDAARETVRAQERERIGSDSRDELAGVLSLAADLLRRACQHPAELGNFRDEIATSFTLLTQARRQILDTSEVLSAPRGERRALAASLRELGKSRVGTAGDMSVDVRTSGVSRPLSAEQDSVLMRIAHEAVLHLQAQSRASYVGLRLHYTTRAVELTVRDNGSAMGQRSTTAGLHSGLRAMKQRVTELGGHLALQSHADQGVSLRVVLPTEA